MVVELSAVRLLAPSFGDSAPVWTNVIGVILFALALGALAGGICADRGMGRRLLPAFLWIAGGAVFALPFLVPRLASWILPEALPLDRALPILVEGSLGVTLLVFAPPVLLLGGVSPVLIELGSRGGSRPVGRTSGIVYAAGTIGSLAGTFLATHLLVPSFGLHNTFAIAAGCLISAGVVAALGFGQTRRLPAAAVALVPAVLLSIGEPRPIWLAENDQLLEVVDSRYQRLAVLESKERVGDRDRRVRQLKINEGLDSFHSVWIEGTPFTNGRYYDTFALLPFVLPARDPQGDVAVLSLGCAAGSILRVLQSVLGSRMRAVGVDLDPAVIELGRRWFALPHSSEQWRLIGDLDARVYVERVQPEQRFQLICLDTYRNQIYLPAHLASVEFFQALQRRLADDGILAMNVGDHTPDGPVLSSIAGTLAHVFATVESFRVSGARNFLLFAHDGEPGLLARAIGRATRPPNLPEWLWKQAMRPGACRSWQPASDDRLLTDARSALGRLHERLYSRLHPIGGDR